MLNNQRSLTDYLSFPRTPFIRKQADQSKHDEMVRFIANHHSSQKGSNVYADHIGWVNGAPDEINGYIPDVTVYTLRGRTIIEVESLDSCMSSHTMEQLKAFNRTGDLTIVAVPKVNILGKIQLSLKKIELEKKLLELGLKNVVVIEL